MKWGELQIISLQKMYLITESVTIDKLEEMKLDETYYPYLNSMAAVCNEAINRICTNYKYILKTAMITLETAGTYNRYNLKVLIPDLYKFVSLIKEIPELSNYQKTLNYKFEGESTIIIPNDSEAIYSIEYYGYPVQITSDTLATYELDIANEVAVLLPLYIASQLYKDDDLALATAYRNEFEVGIGELSNVGSSDAPQFESSTGWV